MIVMPERLTQLRAGSHAEGEGSAPNNAAIVVIMIGRNRSNAAQPARPSVMGSRFCAAPLPSYGVVVSAPPRILLYSSLPAGSLARRGHKWEESHELVTS
jgi:hypothetical protein